MRTLNLIRGVNALDFSLFHLKHPFSIQLEHTNERYKLLESAANSSKREAEALRDKSQQLSVSLAKVETSFEVSKQELSEVKEKLLKAEVQPIPALF